MIQMVNKARPGCWGGEGGEEDQVGSLVSQGLSGCSEEFGFVFECDGSHRT